MSSHLRNEQRSIALHRAVANKLSQDPHVLTRAKERVESWRLDGSVHQHYTDAWTQVLALAPEDIAQQLVDPGERMTSLRQCSPFAGALNPRERWQILRQLPISPRS